MPDYGIIKPLCQELGITVSELIDGEVKADSSIRVFDEEQILDMLGRIQQLEKCKCQYKNVGFLENKSVGFPTSLFSIFLVIFRHILHLIL